MYQPSEDSFFLSEELEKYLQGKKNKIKILDLGSGSGILASSCLNLGFINIIAADIDSEAIKYLKNKFKNKIKVIKSDLFSNISKSKDFDDSQKSKISEVRGKFDLIIFNPPYLPENKYDKEKDTTAGKKGNEIIIKFLEQAKNHLEKNGTILLLFSSFSKPEEILEQARKLKYESRLIASKKLFFEELFIYKFK